MSAATSHRRFAVMSSPAPVPSGDRHHLVDALRGFALLGIVIVNVEFILQPSELGWMAFTSDTDRFVRWLVATLGATKIYPIFATLFGYGLAIQFRRAGGELGPRYRRRMLVLMGLGVLHGLLFFSGDILVIYAVVGLAAFRLRDTPTATLLHIAAWTYGIAAALWLIVGGLDAIDPTRSSLDTSIDSAYLSGSFFDVVVANFWLWVFTLGFLALLQGPAVVAFFCIGIALGRTDWRHDRCALVGDLVTGELVTIVDRGSPPNKHFARRRRRCIQSGPAAQWRASGHHGRRWDTRCATAHLVESSRLEAIAGAIRKVREDEVVRGRRLHQTLVARDRVAGDRAAIVVGRDDLEIDGLIQASDTSDLGSVRCAARCDGV